MASRFVKYFIIIIISAFDKPLCIQVEILITIVIYLLRENMKNS
jgi:hypothetical protein